MLGIVILFFFDFAQLLVAERLIGVRQIRKGRHPADEAPALGVGWLLLWLSGILYSATIMVLLLTHARLAFHGIALLVISALGFAIRRNAGLKWGLVVMTVEGALRMGLVANLLLAIYVLPTDSRYNWTQDLF
jgi:hypothetical protein